MNNIYFHIIGGAAGDMLLNSLIELGCPLRFLKKELKKLGLGFDIKIKKQDPGPYHTNIKKLVFEGKGFSSHKKIIQTINSSKLASDIKEKAVNTYNLLAKVESKLHHTKNIHYHHLGKIDAILEICGFFIALKYLDVNKIYVSSFPLNRPSPATLQILSNKRIGFFECAYETVTPTAAALLCGYEQADFSFSFARSAMSFGEHGIKDYLVAYLSQHNFDHDTILKIEANVDDMNPQFFENCFQEILKAGAKDVYIENIIMKNSRPAFILNVLCCENDFFAIREAIFKNTTTFGIRYQVYNRDKLPSEFLEKNTKLGKLKFRVSLGNIEKETPEYQNCLSIAKKRKISLSQVYRNIK